MFGSTDLLCFLGISVVFLDGAPEAFTTAPVPGATEPGAGFGAMFLDIKTSLINGYLVKV
jgi:hypothetical protein